MKRKIVTTAMATLLIIVGHTAPAAAPSVTIGAATSVTAKKAVLNGELTAGAPASVTVYWGTDAHDLWCFKNFEVSEEGEFEHTEFSLLSSQTYYFRFHAINSEGEAWSDTASFSTPGITPNPRYGGGFYGGYASASTIAAIPPSATIFILR
jgi:hypothetical protein